jgi:pilus assembly protein Flp/PilA
MKAFMRNVGRFVICEDGPTAVEYSIMLALIILVCFAAVITIGVTTNTLFEHAANSTSRL